MLVIVLISIVLVLAVPSTRDAITGDKLKKASRQFIGLERKLRVDAVRDQTDYVLCIDLPNSAYWIITSDMTPEKQDEIKKNPKHLPDDVVIADVVGENNKRNPTAKQGLFSEKIMSVLRPSSICLIKRAK